jgi:hypothetical protein
MAAATETFELMLETMKKAAGALQAAGVPFLLGGGLACWARGGPPTEHDVDFLIRPEDVDVALDVLSRAGLRTERPPEQWLVKAYDGDILIDLIFEPSGLPVDEAMFARSEEIGVHALNMQVAALEDVLTAKLLAISEQKLDYQPSLEIARALREQIDWGTVARATSCSPYARAFMTLVEELEIAPGRPPSERRL